MSRVEIESEQKHNDDSDELPAAAPVANMAQMGTEYELDQQLAAAADLLELQLGRMLGMGTQRNLLREFNDCID